MNIVLSLFVANNNDVWSVGAYMQHTETKDHYFFGEIAANEESAIIAILEAIDNKFDELGSIQFITTTTKMFNFLCRGKSREGAPPATAVRAILKKMNAVKKTKFKKNEEPDENDVVGLSRADMINTHITRRYFLDKIESIIETDKSTFTEMKRAYKKIPQIFLGSKIFYWGPTEEVILDGEPMQIYYNGNFTPKTAGPKKDNSISEFEKALRSKLYTYYTGSNSKLTDAGQRSLEEIRSITLVNEKNPLIEKFFELQQRGVAKYPITPVCVGNIDKIVGGAASNRLMNNEDHWFGYNSDSSDIVFNGITRTDISYVFYPQRLGPRIRNQFMGLKDRFIRHLQGDLIGEEYDITDEFYDYSTGKKDALVCDAKKILNGKFNFVKIPKINFDGANFTLKYTFDIDCPPVRVLKALSKLNPKVSIVFENLSDTTIGYYTIIRTDIGVSIYSCPEGSRLVRRKR